ncbi:MAG: hypothetical protein M1482_00875 [Chloroflexi bacterium]|nr:hypothetical protein [Chloroflexota bacterium]
MEAMRLASVGIDERLDAADIVPGDSSWKSIYRLGGAAALATVLVGLAEIFITFLPGGARVASSNVTVVDWFTAFQNNGFMGLRNLGLLNIILTALAIPLFVALYGAHRRVNAPYAALALIVSVMSVAVFYATNRAFSMLALSNAYAAATTEAQRAALIAAGQAMLAVGESHTPGTFLAFFLSEAAGIIMGAVMLQGRIFGRATAWAGILAFTFLMGFEVCSSFVPALFDAALILALCGGVLSMAWDILAARTLFELARHAP